MAEHRTERKSESKKKVPWVEVYDDFYVLTTPHGCLVKTEGMIGFIPGGTAESFPQVD